MAKIKGRIQKAFVEKSFVEEPLVDESVISETEPPKIEEKEKTFVRCPDCPWKAGLKDEKTHCSTCKGSGMIESDPLE